MVHSIETSEIRGKILLLGAHTLHRVFFSVFIWCFPRRFLSWSVRMIIKTGSQLTLFLIFSVVTIFLFNLTSYISVCPVTIRCVKLFVHRFVGWFDFNLDWWIINILLLLFVWLKLAVVSLFQNIRAQLILSSSIWVNLSGILWLSKTILVVPRCIRSHSDSFSLLVVIAFSRSSQTFVLMSQNTRLKLVSLSVFASTWHSS